MRSDRLTVSLVVLVAMSLGVSAFGQEGDLRVLPVKTEAGPTKRMLRRHLHRKANEAFERRRKTIEALKTPDQIQKYAEDQRNNMRRALGFWDEGKTGNGFPEKTPLNARTVGRFEGDGFVVEKVIFESQPKHFVTALLYLPAKTTKPVPGVLIPCGHSSNGKAAGSYQLLGMSLARHGMAALCYDPIGQGERYQLLDDKGKRRFRSTDEHTLVGVGSILVGRNTATYRIWDGVRALDYLESRKEVDGKKLGCAGNSGGGTLTEYLMALDDRIVAAAPGCSVTTFERKIVAPGPGDAEQNIFGQFAFGLDHADYIHMRAPKPTLICAATHDFVNIKGTWDVFREAKRIYARLGASEKVDLIEADRKHGMSQPLREATVQWMRRWLMGIDQPVTEPASKPFSEAQVRCTPRGQVMLLDEARSVLDINRSLGALLKYRRRLVHDEGRSLADQVAILTAGLTEDLQRKPSAQDVGTVARNGYTIRKLVLTVDTDLQLPGLLFEPTGNKDQASPYLYLHEHGKAADAAPGGPIEKLVKAGHTVLAIDLRGTGETGPSGDNLWGGDWDDIFVSYLLGETMVYGRTIDAMHAARWLAAQATRDKAKRIRVIAVGRAGPPALHAVYYQRSIYNDLQAFESLHLERSITRWADVLNDPNPRGQLVNVRQGVLRHYDLQDLIDSFPKGFVTVSKEDR